MFLRPKAIERVAESMVDHDVLYRILAGVARNQSQLTYGNLNDPPAVDARSFVTVRFSAPPGHFGKRHLDYFINEFTTYCNTKRAHMERDHLPPIRDVPEEVDSLAMDQIEVKSHVGGLVRSLERKAA